MSNTLKCAKYIANKYQILVRKFGRDKGIVQKIEMTIFKDKQLKLWPIY